MRTKRILFRLPALKSWYVLLVLCVVGGLVFSGGLLGGFQGDDFDQIVDNKAIHSLANMGALFSSGTFWNGESLSGDFYRPMMSLTFAVIYALFGASPVAFHIVQLILYLAASFVLFLFLKKFLKPWPAFLAVLLLVVHPINTQVVYSIPCMQEPLFFLPGMGALYILSRSPSFRSLVWASGLLLVALLAKETALMFVALAALYVFMYRRPQFWIFIKLLVAPVLGYFIVRYAVVGHTSLQHISPISDLGFLGRMLTVPSIILFYFSTFFWPQSLATNYYWVEPVFTVQGVLLPLVAVLAIGACFWLGGWYVKRYGTKPWYKAYIFFMFWTALGLAPHLQLIQLDMTACETWFYIAQVGVVAAMSLVLLVAYGQIRKAPYSRHLQGWKSIVFYGLVAILYAVVVTVLGVRSWSRGLDYTSQSTLAIADIAVNANNYFALNNLGRMELRSNNLVAARSYVQRSINAYPAVSNYNNLGVIAQKEHKLREAQAAYEASLRYGSSAATYINLAIIYSATQTSQNTVSLVNTALERYPKNTVLLNFLAIHQAALGQRSQAIKTLNLIYTLGGAIPGPLAVALQTGAALDVPIAETGAVIHIPASN